MKLKSVLTMSTTASVAAEMEDSGDLEDVDLPYVVKDRILMSPGTWNGMDYTAGEIEQALNRTDWEDERQHNASLFLDHEDRDASKWVGKVTNVHMDGDDLKGDIEVTHKETAIKLAYGAKFGISPKVEGRSSDGRTMEDFTFENFSVVVNPAVKTTWLNSELQQVAEHLQKELTDDEVRALADELDVDVEGEDDIHVTDLFSEKVEQIQGESSMAQEDNTTQEPEDAEVDAEADADAEAENADADADAEADADTETQTDVDDIVDAVMSKVDDRLEEFEVENSDEDEVEEDADEEADADAEDAEAEAENAEEETEDDVSADDIDSFQEFAADYRDNNPDAALSTIVDEYEEEQKDVDQKVDEKVDAKVAEVKSEMEEQLSALKDTLDSKQQEIEEMSQKVEEAPSRASVKDGGDARQDVVEELSDKDSENLDKMFMAALHKKQGTDSVLRGGN